MQNPSILVVPITVQSADAKADVANGFAAKVLFHFSQDFSLANFFKVVIQGDWRIPA
jgi:hypothetical protein